VTIEQMASRPTEVFQLIDSANPNRSGVGDLQHSHPLVPQWICRQQPAEFCPLSSKDPRRLITDAREIFASAGH